MFVKYIFLSAIISLSVGATGVSQTSKVKYDVSDPLYNNNCDFLIPPLPDSFSFAGESVPLNDDLIREQWEKELLYNADFFSHVTFIIKLSGKYFPFIEAALHDQGIPEDMKYLCVAESNLQQLISKAGAAGFWQFMPQTATLYDLEVNKYVDERFNIQKSTKVACSYLKTAYKMFGSWTAAAASYNCGQQRYNDATIFQRTTNYYQLILPEETNRYIFRVLTFKYLMENAAALGLKTSSIYEPEHYKVINISSAINDLVSFAVENKITYKELKLHNPWLRDKILPVRKGKTYTLLLPDKK